MNIGLRHLSLAVYCLILGLFAGVAQATFLVVHLPSTPVENASRRAEAIQKLSNAINAAVPGLELEPQIFRHFADAEAFLAARDDVVLVLSDAAWTPGLPPHLVPSFSVVRDGKTTYQRHLVAKGDAARLSDLQGKQLATVASGGAADLPFLRDRVFGGEIDPRQWFGGLRPTSVDSEVVTDILYGEADAGLVADFNPLLAQHVGEALRVIYTSGDLPLPVLSLSTALDSEQRTALGTLLLGLSTSAPTALSGLGFEAFTALDSVGRSALEQAPSRAAKRFELPAPPSAALTALAPPEHILLPLVLELPLPEPPSAAGELLAGEAGLERK